MDSHIGRQRTPPPTSWPLTPPPTGGFDKRSTFFGTDATKTISKGQNKPKEGEDAESFFNDFNEGSDVDVEESSEQETNTATNTHSPIYSVTDTSYTSQSNTFAEFGITASVQNVAITPAFAEPFPFQKLATSIRHRIYKQLLVIPALICVRQKHTCTHDEKEAYLYAERYDLLPGIAYALAQITVDGRKVRFSRFPSTNINILYANKEVFAEAKAVLYGMNKFEIIKPSNEMTPVPNFGVRLFPPGCQRLVTKLHIRIRSFYDLTWLLTGCYNNIKNYYRGLDKLEFILELESATKGFGRQWARQHGEEWRAYIWRLHAELEKDMFMGKVVKKTKIIPVWIDLSVLFSGEVYEERLCLAKNDAGTLDVSDATKVKRDELRQGLVEAWELFKKGEC